MFFRDLFYSKLFFFQEFKIAYISDFLNFKMFLNVSISSKIMMELPKTKTKSVLSHALFLSNFFIHQCFFAANVFPVAFFNCLDGHRGSGII